MVQITVSDELARAITDAGSLVTLVDSCGRALGRVGPIDDEEWTEAKRQMEIFRREGGSFYTTHEVLEHIKSLEKE